MSYINYLNSDSAMLVLLVIALFQPTTERKIIAIGFSVSCLAHSFFAGGLPGETYHIYYYSAIAIDHAAICLICLLATQNRFTDFMLGACGSSFILNLYGLYIHMNGLAPGPYNLSFYILYIVIGCIFLSKKRGDNEDKRHNRLKLPFPKCFAFHCEVHKEENTHQEAS